MHHGANRAAREAGFRLYWNAPTREDDYYNHSGYADLIITGLIGIRPSAANDLVIRPLVPPGKWDYFALDALPYHSHLLTVIYDRTGERYHRGAGLTILSDGRVIGHRGSHSAIAVVLPDRRESQQAKASREVERARRRLREWGKCHLRARGTESLENSIGSHTKRDRLEWS